MTQAHPHGRVIFAYIEEPPFAWTEDGQAKGCDVSIACTILARMGIEQIELQQVTFPDLLPGVANHQWTINTPLFITEQRSKSVRFSRPVWALSDGLMLRKGTDLNGYLAIARSPQARLGVVRDQVQHQSGIKAGIPSERIHIFETQEEVVQALVEDKVDAYAATAMGHRAFIQKHNRDDLVLVDVQDAEGNIVAPAFGGFSFALSNLQFADHFDAELANYIVSESYHHLMLKHGFSSQDIDLLRSQYR